MQQKYKEKAREKRDEINEIGRNLLSDVKDIGGESVMKRFNNRFLQRFGIQKNVDVESPSGWTLRKEINWEKLNDWLVRLPYKKSGKEIYQKLRNIHPTPASEIPVGSYIVDGQIVYKVHGKTNARNDLKVENLYTGEREKRPGTKKGKEQSYKVVPEKLALQMQRMQRDFEQFRT